MIDRNFELLELEKKQMERTKLKAKQELEALGLQACSSHHLLDYCFLDHDHCITACALLQMAELEREHCSKMAAINSAKENIEAAVSKQNKQCNSSLSTVTTVTRFLVLFAHCTPAIPLVIKHWNGRASHEFRQHLARETLPFKYYYHMRYCSVQSANRTRNPEATITDGLSSHDKHGVGLVSLRDI